jgi:hypothetical protein
MNKRWKRSDQFAVASLIVAVAGTIAAIFVVPEFRQAARLEGPSEPRTAASEGVQSKLSEGTTAAEPREHEASRRAETGHDKKTPRRALVPREQLHDQQEPRNDSRGLPGAPITTAPNGIAISGGNVTNPTVNNLGPPPEPERHIPDEKRAELISWLSQSHGTITINAHPRDAKAFKFAEEWRDIFAAAGWDMKYNGRIHEYMVGSQAFAGVVIIYHGDKPAPGVEAEVPSSGPEMYAAKALASVPGSDNILLGPRPDQPEGSIVILLGPVYMTSN